MTSDEDMTTGREVIRIVLEIQASPSEENPVRELGRRLREAGFRQELPKRRGKLRQPARAYVVPPDPRNALKSWLPEG